MTDLNKVSIDERVRKVHLVHVIRDGYLQKKKHLIS